MKKICKAMVLAAVSAFLLAGCTKGFENMNKNVYGVSDEQMAQDGLALGGMLQQLERSVIVFRDGTYLDSDYQIMYNLCAETWCGYMAPTLSDGHNAGWDVNDGWHRRMFTVKYEYGMGGYMDFEKAAVELGMNNELALARVLKVATMHQVADYYGPIAYSHYGELTNLYDPLDEVSCRFRLQTAGRLRPGLRRRRHPLGQVRQLPAAAAGHARPFCQRRAGPHRGGEVVRKPLRPH